jgi:hypothetical protein
VMSFESPKVNWKELCTKYTIDYFSLLFIPSLLINASYVWSQSSRG